MTFVGELGAQVLLTKSSMLPPSYKHMNKESVNRHIKQAGCSEAHCLGTPFRIRGLLIGIQHWTHAQQMSRQQQCACNAAKGKPFSGDAIGALHTSA